ncbi:MAG: hypothetical protein AMS26_21485 [Bacteroides sp. SM23_62]|nr:MAG: hypothetical protein AMS26_21485 [Bacteroides sp. SM23_62]
MALSWTCILRISGQNDLGPGITILWKDAAPEGEITARYGKPGYIEIIKGKGTITGKRFAIDPAAENGVYVRFNEYHVGPGSASTMVSVQTREHPFSFFLRDVSTGFPIYIPEYNVVVTDGEDTRDFEAIRQAILARQLRTKLEMMETEPEESFDAAAMVTRNQTCPTWLGTSRDIRTFEIYYAMEDAPAEYEIIRPRLVAGIRKLEELNGGDAEYAFVTGRGQGPVLHSERRLEDGMLPILHTKLVDDDISYESVFFVSLECSRLTAENNTGTHYLVADNHAAGHMFTESQKQLLDKKQKEDLVNKEETVLWARSIARNNSPVPRYVWFKTVKPGRGWWSGYEWSYDGDRGFSLYENGRIFCISRLNGVPLVNEEVALLLQPGEQAVFEFCIPHAPISRERAEILSRQSVDERYRECRQFWRDKLTSAPYINLPEKRIEEMMYAGLLHLDLVTYGKEPDGTLAPTIGVYSPIGTESAPIIQYFSSMGWHDIARRSLQYFLDKQHEDGMIQNFGGYMVETGAALWTMGEYFRYTNDPEWLEVSKPALLKSSEFLLRWRKENMGADQKGPGYGMIAGKVADPEDAYHQFMLNAYAYIGLKRVAEMLRKSDPEISRRLQKEAEAWKSDIRSSLFQSMAHAPVIPRGDGTWCPTLPPWPEATGPLALFADPGNCYSHGTFTTRDVLLGPLYLVFAEVLDPGEEASKMILDYHSELFYQQNSAFSQPYYSRHAWLQLKRGLVKPFLRTYYTTVSALADRETYTFWEHLYHASPHKTHEEGWFLMQTRWMLYMEEGDTLRLMPGIPRRWLEDGKEIILENVASYFGPVSIHILSDLENHNIKATIRCSSERKPGTVIVRIPHPGYEKAVNVSGGVYDSEKETVRIESFNGEAKLTLKY